MPHSCTAAAVWSPTQATFTPASARASSESSSSFSRTAFTALTEVNATHAYESVAGDGRRITVDGVECRHDGELLRRRAVDGDSDGRVRSPTVLDQGGSNLADRLPAVEEHDGAAGGSEHRPGRLTSVRAGIDHVHGRSLLVRHRHPGVRRN